MLDQMVESKKSSGAARRGGFLLTTMMLVASVCASGVLWSLFAKDFGVGNESLELSMLVAPIIPAADAPAPEPLKETKSVASPKEKIEMPSRREIIARMDESPIAPKAISTAPNTSRERPRGLLTINKGIETDGNFSASPGIGNGRGGGNNAGGGAVVGQNLKPQTVENAEEPPALKTKAALAAQKTKLPQSLGVINGRAQFLPKPAYPAAAHSLRIGGEVSVQVAIDEFGKVTSAKVLSGHPLLKAVSEAAARSAIFKPTLLSNQPVKVTGIIVYKFSAQ